jgi:hypothetical protein
MKRTINPKTFCFLLLASAVASVTAACNGPDASTSNVTVAPAQSGKAAVASANPVEKQQTFDSPDDAVKALVKACGSKDHADFGKLFGPGCDRFMSGNPAEDADAFDSFLQAASERAVLEESSPATALLHIGNNDWTFPIPISRSAGGRWYFDTVAGDVEVSARRIGANELDAIAICRTYVDAQREYAAGNYAGDDVRQYAQRIVSHTGKQDGLFWPRGEGAGVSPFGLHIAKAAVEEKSASAGVSSKPTAFHGYYFRVLTAQGPDAPGGAYNYVINGRMIAGFAFVAYPEEYGKSGTMTFIVSHQGKVYQKDLGQSTAREAAAIANYNPDKTWSLVSK